MTTLTLKGSANGATPMALAETTGTPPHQLTPAHYLVSALAARWAVSTASIYRMIEARELGHIKVRGAIRIPAHVVETYEANQLAASTLQQEAS